MLVRSVCLAALLALPGCSGCSKAAASDAGAPDGSGGDKSTKGATGPTTPDEDDLVRWVRKDGVEGVIEAARTGERKRPEAYAALGESGELRALAFLAEEAKTREKDGRDALVAASVLVSTPRKQVDPDDAEELRAACTQFLALAKDSGRKKEDRALAVSILRMLVSYGCVRATDIPTDLDPK